MLVMKHKDILKVSRKQINESSIQPTKSVYHRPTDMSDESMAKFSLGKARLDPQRIVPSEMTTVRNHPSAITILRYDKIFKFELNIRFSILDMNKVLIMKLYLVLLID